MTCQVTKTVGGTVTIPLFAKEDSFCYTHCVSEALAMTLQALNPYPNPVSEVELFLFYGSGKRGI